MAVDLSKLLENTETISELSDASQKVRKPHSHTRFVRAAIDSPTGKVRIGPLSKVADSAGNGKSEIEEFVTKARGAYGSINRQKVGAGHPGYGFKAQRVGDPQEDFGSVELHIWDKSVESHEEDPELESHEDDSAYDQNDPPETVEATRARRSRRSA